MEFNFKQLQKGNLKKKKGKNLKENSGFEGIPTRAYWILVGRNLVYMLQARSGNSLVEFESPYKDMNPRTAEFYFALI